MAAENLDAADLAAVAHQGLINEDVMQQYWDISNVPLPLTDRLGTPDNSGNAYCSWPRDVLADPDTNNATVDGADATGNDTRTGDRVGNHHQYPDKVIRVSDRANNSDTIGAENTLEYQAMRRQIELRRDVEAISLTHQASVADDGNSTAGRLGGLGAWLETSTDRGTLGADGGFSGGIVAAATVGNARALSFATIQAIAGSIWDEGGNPSVAMSVPGVMRNLSSFMFTDAARIATLQRNEQGAREAATALAAANVIILDNDVVLEMVANRIQRTYTSADATAVANFYLIDPEYVRHSFLQGYRGLPLARTGTADNRQITCDVTLKVLTEKAHGVIADIDPTLAATA